MNASDLWQAIHDAYSDDEEFAEREFGPPATEDEISLLHNTIGIELPAEFIESLRVHNGCEWLNGFGELLSVAGIIEQWQRYTEWQKSMDYGVGQKNGKLIPLLDL